MQTQRSKCIVGLCLHGR